MTHQELYYVMKREKNRRDMLEETMANGPHDCSDHDLSLGLRMLAALRDYNDVAESVIRDTIPPEAVEP